jgi:hypothetical protein
MAVTWAEFVNAAPEIAEFGAARFSEIPVSMLATVRPDGWPRLHPFEPILAGGHLFLTPPKVRELRDDGRYSAHSTVTKTDGDLAEFSIRGIARPVDDEAVSEIAWTAVMDKGWEPDGPLIAWELLLDEASAIEWIEGKPSAHRWHAAQQSHI